MKIGIDFGSAYSTFSVYDAKDDLVKLIQPTESGSGFVPSISCRDEDGRLCTGVAVKEYVGDPEVRIWSAFKTLLTSRNSYDLNARGFDNTNTPELISREFLNQQLQLILNKYNEEKYEEIIICIPEAWETDREFQIGKTRIREICQGLDAVERIRVVSEPVAASAFFAYIYEKTLGKSMTEPLLLIDYGGGTLDITLTSITSKKDRSKFKINKIAQAGAGENHGDEVGQAGIAYMEAVLKKALIRNGMQIYDGIVKNYRFIKAFHMLETKLMNQTVDLFDIFSEVEDDLSKILDYDDKFTTIKYGNDKLEITYALLYEVYQEVIYPVLNRELNKMCDFMDREKIDYMNRTEDGFKIALVGGFGKYYLVQHQIQQKFNLSDSDVRVRNIGLAESRESAISKGAALIAHDKVSLRDTAKYSVGLAYSRNGRKSFQYAIKYGQEFQLDTVYPVLKSDGKPFVFYCAGQIDHLAVGFKETDQNQAYLMTINSQNMDYVKELAKIPDMEPVCCGISMDDAGIVTLHVESYDEAKDCFIAGTKKEILIGEISQMFTEASSYEVITK